MEAVSQDYKDANGNTTSYSVQAYYGHVMNALRAFGMRPTYDYDAVTHFVNNLSPQIKVELEQQWDVHLGTVLRNRLSQSKLLLEALLEATKA